MSKRKVPRGKSLRPLLPLLMEEKARLSIPFPLWGSLILVCLFCCCCCCCPSHPTRPLFYFLHPHTTPRKPTLLAAGAHKKTTKTKQATCLLSGWVLAGTMEDLVAAAFFPLLRSDRSVFDRRLPRLRPHLSLLPIPFSLFPHPKPKAPFLLARRKKGGSVWVPFSRYSAYIPGVGGGREKGKGGGGQ